MRTREQIAAYKKEWAKRNKERIKARVRRWYIANRSHVIAKSKRWRESNRDRVNASIRRRYANNPESFKIRTRRWRLANPERALASDRRRTAAWQARNPDKVKAANRRPAETLSNTYIRRRIQWGSSVKFTVPIALIEAKRVHLQLKRLIQKNTKSK